MLAKTKQFLHLYDFSQDGDGIETFQLNGQRGDYHYVITGQREEGEQPTFIKMIVARSGKAYTDWKNIVFKVPRFEGLMDLIDDATADINTDYTELNRADEDHKERQENASF